jgi:hypothetical protein
MKKLLAVLLVGVLVFSIPAVSSLRLPRAIQKEIIKTPVVRTDVPDWADGNISGVYAEKNETSGYNILGNVFGYYHISWENVGYYAGVWETLDGNISGEFAGWFFYHITIGEYNITGSNETGGFIGLMDFNESDMTIKSVALAYNEEDYFLRYSLCSYTKFE